MDQFEGILERIRYYSEENGYMVARLRPRGGEPITIVGSFPPLQEGESLLVYGRWQVHSRYGKQVVVERWERLVPATAEGLKRYLSSGLIKGIGPVTAEKIVSQFEMDTLEIMEHEPERLREIEGIGDRKAARILESFRQHRELQNVMVFLQGHGIGLSQALRLYRQYGVGAVEKVREDPYRLADEVFGIGFRSADKIARGMGLEADSPARIRAAITFALGRAAEQGHVYLPGELLEERVRELLAVNGAAAPPIDLEPPLRELVSGKRIYREKQGEDEAVYYAPFYHAEQGVARRLAGMLKNPRRWSAGKTKQALSAVTGNDTKLTGEQALVLRESLQNGVLIVTGGPGTGKTTTIRALLSLYRRLQERVLLAAPTGRAARRVTEATGEEAFTIHRLLEYSFVEGEGFRFRRNEKRPVEAAVVIIDEASMVDLILMHHLVSALPEGSRLVLVGDMDQLPAVGAGNVLKDLINSRVIPCVRLNLIFRQASESMIIVNAHRVNRGEVPYLNVREKDFFFISEEDPEKVARNVVNLCRERIPNFGPFDPLLDIQVITPMRRTPAGVERLNLLLQEALNPSGRNKQELSIKGINYRLGDKVMQIRNNYQKEVYNGDIGLITALDREEGEITVTYRDFKAHRPVIYEFAELDELVLSYAVSVHKSQGSEYPVIIMPVVTQHYMLLQRNLLYTGITRARKLVVLVGTRKALAIAVRNNRAEERYTCLDRRLREQELTGARSG